MDDPGSNGAVGDDGEGDEDDAGEFVAVDPNSEADGTMNATMSPGRRATDRSAVDDQRRESDVDEVLRLRQLEGEPPSPSLDDDDHDAEEVEVVASGPLLRLMAREQSNASAVTNEEEERREEGEEEEEEGHWEQVKQAADHGNMKVQTIPLSTISSVDQMAEVSRRNSNPSLDIMFYQTLLNECCFFGIGCYVTVIL